MKYELGTNYQLFEIIISNGSLFRVQIKGVTYFIHFHNNHAEN
jgi:hypothetical protein